jgi:hypothetical protein
MVVTAFVGAEACLADTAESHGTQRVSVVLAWPLLGRIVRSHN